MNTNAQIHTDLIISLPFTRAGLMVGLAALLIAALAVFVLIIRRRQKQ